MSEALTDQVDAFYQRVSELPFENSDYQTLFFVVAAQQTPERACRAVALQLHSKLKALRTAHYELKREAVEMRRLANVVATSLDEFESDLAAVDLEEKQAQHLETQKLVADATHTVALLQQLLDSFPTYNRAAFEAGESAHFKARLSRQVQLAQAGPAAGALEAIENMSVDLLRLAEQVPGLLAIAEAAGVLALPAPASPLPAPPAGSEACENHPFWKNFIAERKAQAPTEPSS